ncbi:zinc transporter ZntB [Shewanella sp. 1_MG-2023]|uniref:Zinc transporter ZntB n=1 Tax=Shewanella electrodiphila TaxID=934143 RepID=A0ABT0KP90_9GAMM|nr:MULTISPECIES: zinc transporter ZntB [Shewanella]MCC4834322.1 zinc transporter ZntB [Shewanella sp. 10N.7]MCL1045519.1 zinc transporter ZntB [Shewanella electrodiphila]MDO6611489.1 zinc transporter ZntB [Shewanella sp. 7_MG-2023]MDO6771344.1 zinc transporter ZntB [Shewanella sp. 2_MG-2023]MDO6793570.1 zinc transporter ZntB [Shewanella sp. 1_MG-2023]
MDTGFIYCLLLSGPNAGQSITPSELNQWQPEDGLLWVHLRYSDEEAKQWVIDAQLPQTETDTLLAEHTRPRSLSSQDGVLMVLRGINLNPNSSPEDMVSMRIFAQQHRIVSTCERQLQSVKDIAEQIISKPNSIDSSADFLVSLCERLTHRKMELIHNLEDQLDDLDDQITAPISSSLRSDIAELRKQTVTLRRYFSPQRDALSRLLNDGHVLFNSEHKLRIREINETLIRVIEDLDAVRDRASVTQEQLQSQQAEQLNKRLYFLSLISAIFLPLGFLTGLLGVNIGGIPGTENTWAFAMFSGGLILLVAIQMWLFYRWKWL